MGFPEDVKVGVTPVTPIFVKNITIGIKYSFIPRLNVLEKIGCNVLHHSLAESFFDPRLLQLTDVLLGFCMDDTYFFSKVCIQ